MSPVTIELRKGRKRRPSNSLEDVDDPVMDDCMAAMVLMSLSCSPKSTFIPDRGIYSVSVKSIDSGVGFGSTASRSNTPSPCTINEEPLAASPIAIEINNNSNHVETIKGNNDSNVDNNQINGLTITHKDEGIDMDETIDFIIEDPIQTIAEKARRIVFKCTWRGCGLRCDLVESIEKHIRTVHLGRSENASEEENDHEEEFYYAEIEEEMEIDDNISSKDSSSSNDSSLGPLSPVSSSPESPHSTNYNLSPTLSSASLLFFAPSPTWSHLDMARPPHEDPEYQKQQKQMQLQLQLQQQQIQIQNQQVQNFNHHLLQQTQQQQPSSVTQTFISAQFKPEPERKTVISSPINIPGISVAHRWSTKVLDSSSASSSNASCNSSYSFSNSHHHHHHHLNQHIHNNHHHHQSQASFITSSSPVNFFSPKAPSKVMRLSSNTSSPINIKSSGSNNNTTSITSTLSGTVTVNSNSKTNSNNVTSIISSSNNPTMSTNTTTNANNNASSNQWTSLLQSSSTSSSASSSSSSSASSSSSSTTGTATTLLKGSSISPTRRTRTETRKCRKVYGMDNRDSWCTQCKWKKACTRFVD